MKHLRRIRIHRLLSAVVVLFLVFGCAEVCLGCPSCKETLAEQNQGVQQGYVLSIGVMMATPFTILAGWTFAIYRMLKKQKLSALAG